MKREFIFLWISVPYSASIERCFARLLRLFGNKTLHLWRYRMESIGAGEYWCDTRYCEICGATQKSTDSTGYGLGPWQPSIPCK